MYRQYVWIARSQGSSQVFRHLCFSGSNARRFGKRVTFVHTKHGIIYHMLASKHDIIEIANSRRCAWVISNQWTYLHIMGKKRVPQQALKGNATANLTWTLVQREEKMPMHPCTKWYVVFLTFIREFSQPQLHVLQHFSFHWGTYLEPPKPLTSKMWSGVEICRRCFCAHIPSPNLTAKAPENWCLEDSQTFGFQGPCFFLCLSLAVSGRVPNTKPKLGDGNSRIFLFSPLSGEDFPFD